MEHQTSFSFHLTNKCMQVKDNIGLLVTINILDLVMQLYYSKTKLFSASICLQIYTCVNGHILVLLGKQRPHND